MTSNGTLTMNVSPGFSPEIRTGSGVLTLGGNLVLGQTNAPLTHALTPSAVINGTLDLGNGGNRTITVTDGNAANDLVIATSAHGRRLHRRLDRGLHQRTTSLDAYDPQSRLCGPPLPATRRDLHLHQPAGLWGSNQTWVYTGQFFDADGFFAFAENIDDSVQIFIDGVLRLTNAGFNVPTTTGSTTSNPAGGTQDFGMGPLGDGWHNIEIRMQNGGGAARRPRHRLDPRVRPRSGAIRRRTSTASMGPTM